MKEDGRQADEAVRLGGGVEDRGELVHQRDEPTANQVRYHLPPFAKPRSPSRWRRTANSASSPTFSQKRRGTSCQREHLESCSSVATPRPASRRQRGRARSRPGARSAESPARGLAEARLGAPDGAHLAGEPDLAHTATSSASARPRARRRPPRPRPGRPPARRRAAARHVQEHVLVVEREPHALLEHGEEERHAAGVEADGGPARRASPERETSAWISTSRGGCLERGQHGRARRAGRPFGEEGGRGVRDLREPASPISNTATSLVEPKRFLTARSTRRACAPSPSK